MMIKWRKICVIPVMMLVVLMGTYISNSMTEYYAISQQKAIIGRLYEEDTDACEKVLAQMFDNMSEKDITSGNEALLEFGYTQDGLDYWYEQNDIKRVHDISLVFQSVIVCGTVFLIVGLYKKQEDAMVKRLEEKLVRASELRDKEIKVAKEMAQKFVENIAHQIKTPLACVSLSLDMLLVNLQEDKQREKVKEAFQYLEQIEVLMKRLLDIGRLEAGKVLMKKELVSLEEIIRSCMKYLDPREQRIVLETENEQAEPAEFYGDYDWLKEAFSNILKNSLEHDLSGEKVSVKLRCQKELIFIRIRDYGSGIPLEDIQYIFDRFYIPEKAKKGHTGIGLNLAKLVVEKHFGTIEAVNHEEGGAQFSICFPLYGLKNEKM